MAGASDGFRKIGILGGMGVEATLELMKRVHAATETGDDQDHFPMLVDMNPQVGFVRVLSEQNHLRRAGRFCSFAE